MKNSRGIGGWLWAGLISMIVLISAPPLSPQTLRGLFNFKHPRHKAVTIKYKYSNKAVIIPIKINNSDTLHFILDSGLGTTLITELTPQDSFIINYAHKVQLHGLGTGPPIEAFKSYGNNIKISTIENSSEEINVLLQNLFSLSNKAGTQIHGIIGHSLFSRFIIEIDYTHNKITFHRPETYIYKKWKRAVSFPLEINGKKAFFNTFCTLHNGKRVRIKLLLDTGSSMSIWLAEGTHPDITVPPDAFKRFLGQGLNGDIYGKIGRIQSLEIGPYTLKEVITAFPDTLAIRKTIQLDERNGSVGGEILRRFRVIIDYPNNKVTFFRNSNFKDKFTYNMSGIELETPYPDLPIFKVYYVSKGSPADLAGIKKGDQIISLNGISTYSLTMDQLLKVFHNEHKKKIKLKILRNGIFMIKKMQLEKKI